jgi:hypothetical protein
MNGGGGAVELADPDRPIREVPLNSGGPVDPEHVIGREEELKGIFDAFKSVGVVLTGERRLGKTSLASLVARDAKRLEWDVIRQSAEGFRTLEEFGASLIRRLEDAKSPVHKALEQLKGRWRIRGPLIEISALPPGQRLLEDIVNVSVERSQKRLLLIIDELPVFARDLERQSDGDGTNMLHLLRRLRQEHPDKLRMLCLGSIGFHHAVRDGAESVLNDLKHHRLGPLSHPNATYLAACIFHGDKRAAPEYEREVAPVVAEKAEGIPYYVHQFAAEVLSKYPVGCSRDDVEDIIKAAFGGPGDRWDLRHYVNYVATNYGEEAPLARAILDALATRPTGLTFDELVLGLATNQGPPPDDGDRVRDLLRRLEADHYLVCDGDRHRFAFDLIRRAWIAHRT